MSEIARNDETTHGNYRIEVEGSDRPAELTWQARGEARIVDHTFTPPAARGKGIAFKLVEAVVADARAQGFTIVPQCPYVAAQFRKHPEWADVRAQIES
ncbi:GNAT family N-acetyltransferase [Aurantiacibacter poecillastricola]|uniref:GNAT family N-acetyltransferase n=1 Tax=Aurantiacibacter poecillastricola TaxID=3064385 RepID=UPI00273E8EE8|nr:GNAT family N-acetyltransferase [Aurantiacibacter sp. 219JJ12-13]MDP5260420.1 GNAT family N-acetyltransferase [Aurantiacibacter sp. 219JJ12-13]